MKKEPTINKKRNNSKSPSQDGVSSQPSIMRVSSNTELNNRQIKCLFQKQIKAFKCEYNIEDDHAVVSSISSYVGGQPLRDKQKRIEKKRNKT